MNIKQILKNLIPDKLYLQIIFYINLKQFLNLKKPYTFNEKMQWLKLYDHNPKYTKLADKYEVKEIIARMIGNEYIIPTLGVWDKFDDIEFSKMPSKFVLKCTHDSGSIIIVKDKETMDVQKIKKEINLSLQRNYFYEGREWPYKNIKPRIIAEKYMEEDLNSDKETELNDYKFMCFDGKVKCSFVCTERYSNDGVKVTFFDKQWKKMPFERHYPQSEKEIERPYNYEKMIELAEILSNGIPFVRVDFYEINQKIYFGELTFYPGGGLEEFTPYEWDEILGSWINLPIEGYNKQGKVLRIQSR